MVMLDLRRPPRRRFSSRRRVPIFRMPVREREDQDNRQLTRAHS